MSINAGDAVLRFLGDSTQLDSKFGELKPNAEKAFGGASDAAESFADAAEDAGLRTRNSMGEARGEVALLGEEFGIRLPRHVRTFVAELPGVGAGLSAAFEATAILFVVQAIIQASEKLTKLTEDFLIFTDEMKASNEEVGRHNTALLKLKEAYDQDTEASERFGKSTLELAVMKVAKLTKALDDARNAASRLKEESGSVELQYSRWGAAIDAVASKFGLGTIMLDKALGQQANAVAEAQDKMQEAEKDTANKERELALAKRQRDAEALKEFQKHIQALNEADNARTELFKRNEEAQNEAQTARAALDKALTAEHIKQVQLENEADTARTTLFHQQEEAQNEAENARWKMEQDHLKAQQEMEDARARLYAQLKKEDDDLRKQTSVTFQTLAASWMKAAAPLKQLGAEGQEAFNKLTTGLQSAISASLLSQQSIGKAMEEMTKQVLASVAAQALVKALYYTAEGTAALFENPPAAGAFFAAAAEMGAVGAAAGLAARYMPGGGSGGGTTEQSHTSASNTGQSNRSGGSAVGVQAFATGGLITGPTLALIGENRNAPTEAVLPLDDPSAMKTIGKAIGQNGATHHHWNINGLVSDDKLVNIMGKMSKLVKGGKAELHASNSLRVTKRSA